MGKNERRFSIRVLRLKLLSSATIISVHGLGRPVAAGSESTWTFSFPDALGGLEKLGKLDRLGLISARVFEFRYESDILAAGSDLISPAGIWRLAAQLLDCIKSELEQDSREV